MFPDKADDVLLRPGEHAYLLGDAAGLNDAFSGGGIHYALLSAQALAASFAGGDVHAARLPGQASSSSFTGKTAYEQAMLPHVNFIKKNSDNVKQYYAAACAVVS